MLLPYVCVDTREVIRVLVNAEKGRGSYRRALECNSVRRYSYLALLEFKLLAAAGGCCRFDLESATSSSSPIPDNDSRRRCTFKGRPFHRIPLYHSTVSQRGKKQRDRTLAASRVTQWNRMSESDTMGRSIPTVRSIKRNGLK